MAFTFTQNIKSFVAQSLTETISSNNTEQRQPSTLYQQGTQVAHGGYIYAAATTGVTNAGAGPTHTQGTGQDGTVSWLWIGADRRSNNSLTANLYLGIGKQDEWADPSTPDTPETAQGALKGILEDITCFIRLTTGTASLGFKTVDWESGQVYSKYDPSLETYPHPHYVIVNDTQVYLCIDNNGGIPSVDQPTGTDSNHTITPDGYIWKYAGTISARDQYLFKTDEHSPLPSFAASSAPGSISRFDTPINIGEFDDGDAVHTEVRGRGMNAHTAPQFTTGVTKTITRFISTIPGRGYDDKSFAVAWVKTEPGTGAICNVALQGGAVNAITLQAPGENYQQAQVLIVGDGTGATATCQVSASGAIEYITITSGGSGYTWAEAVIIPGTVGSVARAVIAPIGGHGSNLAAELGASTLILSGQLLSTLNQYIPTQGATNDGSFRQITLVSNVQPSQGVRHAPAYLGPAHPNYHSTNTLNKYQRGTGHILYVNNIPMAVHSNRQEEIIKISLTI